MKKKIISFINAGLILVLFFGIGFVGVNVVMKIIIGHGNEVTVPDLQGEHFDVARKKCRKLGMFIQEVETSYSDSIPDYRIISQFPKKHSRIKKNRTVDVIVSKGPELLKIPFLDNLKISHAKHRLENLGLKTGKIEYRYSNEVEKNNVIYTKPLAEEFIPKGHKVTIYVSLGKLPNTSNKYQELYNND